MNQTVTNFPQTLRLRVVRIEQALTRPIPHLLVPRLRSHISTELTVSTILPLLRLQAAVAKFTPCVADYYTTTLDSKTEHPRASSSILSLEFEVSKQIQSTVQCFST